MEKESHEIKLSLPVTITFIPERPMFEKVVLEEYNKKYEYESPLEPNTKLFCSISFKGTRTDRYPLIEMANEVLSVLEGVAFDSKINIQMLLVSEDSMFESSIEVHILPLDQLKNMVRI